MPHAQVKTQAALDGIPVIATHYPVQWSFRSGINPVVGEFAIDPRHAGHFAERRVVGLVMRARDERVEWSNLYNLGVFTSDSPE